MRFSTSQKTNDMRFILTLGVLFSALVGFTQATWQQLDSVPGPGRFWAAATGNSTHGFAGCGRLQFSGLNNTVNDMYQYEAATGVWTQIPDYPAGVREGITAFTIGERVFFAFGTAFIQFTKSVYEYLPASGTWEQKPDVPGIGFAYSHGFVIDDTYYIGPENGTNNVYAFNATSETWSQVASFPGDDRRAQCAFAVNGKGYIGMGMGVFGGVLDDWWQYDPISDAWTEIASIFPTADQASATSVGDLGFVYNTGGGTFGGKQLYQYDAANNQWIPDALLPTDRIANASVFTIGQKGYLVFGEQSTSSGNTSSNQLWEFTPGTDYVSESANDPFGIDVQQLPNGEARLTSKTMLSNPEISVYSMNGTLVSAKVEKPGYLNCTLDALPVSGLYLLVVKDGDLVSTTKMVSTR